MNGKKRYLRLPLLVSILALLFSSASGGVGVNGERISETPDHILRYALHAAKLDSFDPDFGKGSQNLTYADMVFNALWRYQPGQTRILEPDLAAAMPEFKIIRGRQVWTVHLRQKVFFHPSPYYPAHELTADDVVFSFQKAANPETSLFSGGFRGMEFRSVDSHTLEISLDQSISPLFFSPCWPTGGGDIS